MSELHIGSDMGVITASSSSGDVSLESSLHCSQQFQLLGDVGQSSLLEFHVV